MAEAIQSDIQNNQYHLVKAEEEKEEKCPSIPQEKKEEEVDASISETIDGVRWQEDGPGTDPMTDAGPAEDRDTPSSWIELPVEEPEKAGAVMESLATTTTTTTPPSTLEFLTSSKKEDVDEPLAEDGNLHKETKQQEEASGDEEEEEDEEEGQIALHRAQSLDDYPLQDDAGQDEASETLRIVKVVPSSTYVPPLQVQGLTAAELIHRQQQAQESITSAAKQAVATSMKHTSTTTTNSSRAPSQLLSTVPEENETMPLGVMASAANMNTVDEDTDKAMASTLKARSETTRAAPSSDAAPSSSTEVFINYGLERWEKARLKWLGMEPHQEEHDGEEDEDENTEDPNQPRPGFWERSRSGWHRSWRGRRGPRVRSAGVLGSDGSTEGSTSGTSARAVATPLDVDEIIDVIFSSHLAAAREGPTEAPTEGGGGLMMMYPAVVPPRCFPQPVPLPQMVDILQDLWEAEGLDA